MDNIRFYEINAKYVDYLAPYAPHLFHNSKKGQANQRKYIGIVFQINDMEYFAPLSSFKPKHEKMKEGLDFIKILRYAVINLNNMFPVPYSERVYVNFETIKDPNYKSLLLVQSVYDLPSSPSMATAPLSPIWRGTNCFRFSSCCVADSFLSFFLFDFIFCSNLIFRLAPEVLELV